MGSQCFSYQEITNMFTENVPYQYQNLISISVFLPNAYAAYSTNIYIPSTVEWTNNDLTLTLHKRF